LLGSRWAFISQASYIIIGLCGLPVFSGFKNGMVALPGPTGGYIIGFMAAAFVTGYIIGFMAAAFVTGYIYENLLKKCPEHTGRLSRTFASYAACIASCTAGVMIIHFFGFIHLFGYFYSTNINLTVLETLVRTWKLGTWPFLLIDFLKATVAVIIINPVKSKK
jgi:biotin transporter BioY